MATTQPRANYAAIFGPTVGDKVRLADPRCWIPTDIVAERLQSEDEDLWSAVELKAESIGAVRGESRAPNRQESQQRVERGPALPEFDERDPQQESQQPAE